MKTVLSRVEAPEETTDKADAFRSRGWTSDFARKIGRIDRYSFDCHPPRLDVTFWQISVKVAGKRAKIGVSGGNSKITKPLWLKDFHPWDSPALPHGCLPKLDVTRALPQASFCERLVHV